MAEKAMQRLNTIGIPKQQDSNQVVEVQFPDGGKRYSYVGSGNLRAGHKIKNAPVTHPKSGTNYTAPVKIVATHNLVGAQVGDKVGIGSGKVKTIPTGLKYLPGAKESEQNRQVDIRGKNMSVSDYMQPFNRVKMKKSSPMGEMIN